MGQRPDEAVHWWEPRLAVALAALGAAVLWLPPLASSFWLDETGTVWLIQGSLGEALDRTLSYQGGSPLYYVFAWAARQISPGELALRVPSVLAMAAATYLLYVLGKRLFDRRTGLLAAALFPALPAVVFTAGDARPYASALLTLIGSAVVLVRWLEGGRLRDGVIFAVAVVATVYTHYLIAIALLAQVVLLAGVGRKKMNVSLRQAAIVGALGLLLALPLAPNALHVLGQRGVLSNPNPMSPESILSALAPPLILAAIILPTLVAAFVARKEVKLPRPPAVSLLFVIAWLVVPVAVLMVISGFTSTDVLVTRYFLSITPAICLLLGLLVSVAPRPWMRYLFVALGIAAGMTHAGLSHTTQDWRAAATAERRIADDDTPVVLFSGFIEAKQSSWLTDSERSSYLEAPAAAYPLQGNVYAGPWNLGSAEKEYLDDLLTRHLLPAEKFVVLTSGASSATRTWIDPRANEGGFQLRLVDSWDGKIFLYVYERAGEGAGG